MYSYIYIYMERDVYTRSSSFSSSFAPAAGPLLYLAIHAYPWNSMKIHKINMKSYENP